MATPSVPVPGWAAQVMYDLGVPDVPTYAEGTIFDIGKSWLSNAGRYSAPVAQARDAAQQIVTGNTSAAVTAFGTDFTGPGSPVTGLASASAGAKGIGVGAMALSGIGLALKLAAMGYAAWLLVSLAMAASAAFVTGGGSLLAVAGEREVAKAGINTAINTASDAVLGS